MSIDTSDQAQDPLLAAVGRRVRALRKSAGMTQQEFADAAGMSQQYAQRIDSGRQNLSLRSLSRIALALGTSMSALLDGVEPDPNTLGTRRRTGGKPIPD